MNATVYRIRCQSMSMRCTQMTLDDSNDLQLPALSLSLSLSSLLLVALQATTGGNKAAQTNPSLLLILILSVRHSTKKDPAKHESASSHRDIAGQRGWIP